MNKKQKLVYDIFFIILGIFIVWRLCGGKNPWNTQRPLYIRGMEIPLYITAGVGVYVWRNFRNWTSLTRKRVAIVSLIIMIVLGGLTAYVNNCMPHGEMIYTGDKDDEGRAIYFEDYRELNIPDWAKVIRGNFSAIEFILFAMALMSFGLFDYNKDKQESDRFI
jgi:hypothetical protein